MSTLAKGGRKSATRAEEHQDTRLTFYREEIPRCIQHEPSMRERRSVVDLERSEGDVELRRRGREGVDELGEGL